MHHGDTPSHGMLQTLGRYRLLQPIGRGGMGEVWLAEDPRLHRQVAIKTLPTHSQDDREFLLRFEREAQAAAALNHPHILPVYDYGDQSIANGQSITYLVMPHVSGGSLSNRIKALRQQQTQIPPQEALQYLMQAAEAIDYAHDQGIVHRDIKPGNMLMRSENWLLLADFGIAQLMSSREKLTETGVGFGTPEYMAPEQARGKAVPSSDNYSLAVIAFYLLAGQLPFKADSPYATTIQHLTMPPPSPRQFNSSLPLAVDAILLQGLAKYPTQRPPSCRAFVGELQRAIDDPDSATLLRDTPAPPIQQSPFPLWQNPEPSATEAASAGSATVSQPDVPDQPTSQPQLKSSASPVTNRRNLLIGGTAALVTTGGSLAVWYFLTQRKWIMPPSPTPSITPTSAADPLAPAMILRAHNSPIWNLAFSAAKNSLVLASTGKEDQFVLLWDIQKLQKQASTATPIDQYDVKQTFPSRSPMICWSRDGKYIAVGQPEPGGSAFDETTMTVYTSDLNAPAPGFTKPVIVTGSNSLQGLTWYQNKYVVTGNNLSSLTNPNGKNKFQIGLVDITQSQPQWVATTFDGYLPSSFGNKTNFFPLAGSHDGSLLAVTDEQTVMVGELTIAEKTLKWQQKQEPLKMDDTSFSKKFSTVIWSPNGDKIGAIYGDTIAVWEWKAGHKGSTLKLDNKPLTAIAWSPTPSSGLVAGGTENGTVSIWNTTEKNLIPVKTFNTGKFKAPIGTLAWSADGQWLAAGLQDNYGSIAIWMYS